MSESQQDIALGLYEKALHHRIADLESRAKALETELKAANEYRDMWKQTAIGQDARAQKAEAKVAELEGIVQSHEIVLSQTAERAQALATDMQGDRALMGVFQGVAQKIRKRLFQAH